MSRFKFPNLALNEFTMYPLFRNQEAEPLLLRFNGFFQEFLQIAGWLVRCRCTRLIRFDFDEGYKFRVVDCDIRASRLPGEKLCINRIEGHSAGIPGPGKH